MIHINRHSLLLLLIILILSLTASLNAQPSSNKPIEPKELNYIFEANKEGYECFRIPAVVKTNKGTILAFAEGRKNGCSDTGNIDLVLKRSVDHGKTWSNLEVVWDDKENTCGNPSPVVDESTGDIFLLSTWNLGTDHESEIIKQTSQDTRRVYVIKSKNDGKQWGKPKEITSEVKLPNWTWYATGPGSGIQITGGKYKNRLIIASDHIEAKTNKYFSHAIYSDDHGKTWQLGGATPNDQVNECEVVELSDHSLMLNMRNYDRAKNTRQIAYSFDGGNSWENMGHHDELIEPICQASILRYNALGKINILFLNPAHTKKRVNMTLRMSENDGKTWPLTKQIFAGPSAYSDLTPIDEENIGLFYEAGHKSPYEGIAWEILNVRNGLEN